ncbi:hypothetical protein BC629DRAFT_1269536, partial [Irpex lacteus]
SHSPSPPRSPALAKLTSLLRQTMRITITDGRLFLGTFAGTDRLLNICSSTQTSSVYPHLPFVGLVLIPWRLVV